MTAGSSLTRGNLETADALRLVVGRLARRLRQHSVGGLTLSQRSALVTLERSGPLRMGDLAAIENVSKPSMTGIVGRLEERGLVRRVPDSEDRRSTRVGVTKTASALLAKSRRLRSAYLAERIGRLSPEERELLVSSVALLDRMINE